MGRENESFPLRGHDISGQLAACLQRKGARDWGHFPVAGKDTAAEGCEHHHRSCMEMETRYSYLH